MLTTYSVGPGQTYGSIGAVPWTSLVPGDTVAIHWQPSAYHEKILISESGTASKPINVVGVPGPQGQQPVIDGANATTSSQFHYYYTPLEESSLVLIQRSADQNYNYKPSYINISGLEFRNAYQTNSFTDASGAAQTYDQFAAAVFIEGANNITIQNSTLDNSGLGLFVLSNGDESHTTRNVLVQGNSIYGNGVPGQYGEHNVYSEAVGITYQYNNFGPLRDGSAGNDLKDRSAGAVIRYNYFSQGGHILDLVDPEDSNIVATDPSFATTYVYGNVLNNGPNGAATLIHFGGDSGNTAIYRPHLEFYDNTVVNHINQTGNGGQWRTILFQLDTNSQSVNAYNNILYNGPATSGATATNFELLNTVGVGTFGKNWVSPGWFPSLDYAPFAGTISGTNNFIVDPNNNPGFVNLGGGDYHLSSSSSAIGRGQAIASGDPAVTMQYAPPTSAITRSSVADLGAFGATSAPKIIPAVVSTTPTSGASNIATSTSLVATFNEAITSGLSFTLSTSSGKVAATLNSASTTATLTPSAPLQASTTYTATITGARDAAGDVMAAPYSWSFTTAAAFRVAPPSSLVAAYNFDEGSGSVLYDVSGNGNNGVVSNATWSKQGKFGGALSFNGSLGSWVTVTDSASLNLTKGMTLEAWVDPTSLDSPDQGWASVISKEQENSSNDIAYALYAAEGSGTPPAGHVLVNNTDTGTANGNPLNTGQWAFLTATYDGTTLSTFVNGVLVDQANVSGSITKTSDPLRIGGDWSGEMFSGLIDNVRIYNTALTSSQINADMTTTVAPTPKSIQVTRRAPTLLNPQDPIQACPALFAATSSSVSANSTAQPQSVVSTASNAAPNSAVVPWSGSDQSVTSEPGNSTSATAQVVIGSADGTPGGPKRRKSFAS